MKAKDLKLILNGMKDDDEIVFELDTEDKETKQLAASLAYEAICGDLNENPYYLGISKVTNYIYGEDNPFEFHPVISLKNAYGCDIVEGKLYEDIKKAIEGIIL